MTKFCTGDQDPTSHVASKTVSPRSTASIDTLSCIGSISSVATLFRVFGVLVLCLGCSADSSKGVSPEPTTSSKPKADSQNGARHSGSGFSVPIPDGFRVATAEENAVLRNRIGEHGQIALYWDDGVSFGSSILIVPVIGPEKPPSDPAACASMATEIKGIFEGTVESKPELAEYPFGRTCEFRMENDKSIVIQSFAKAAEKYWSVTLTMGKDRKDFSEISILQRNGLHALLRGFEPGPS